MSKDETIQKYNLKLDVHSVRTNGFELFHFDFNIERRDYR